MFTQLAVVKIFFQQSPLPTVYTYILHIQTSAYHFVYILCMYTQSERAATCCSCHYFRLFMAHIWMSHVTYMNESCRTYEWVMLHIWMSHVTYMNESCHIYEWVMSHIWMSHVTHMNESCHTYEWVMSHIWISYVTHMYESCHTYE